MIFIIFNICDMTGLILMIKTLCVEQLYIKIHESRIDHMHRITSKTSSTRFSATSMTVTPGFAYFVQKNFIQRTLYEFRILMPGKSPCKSNLSQKDRHISASAFFNTPYVFSLENKGYDLGFSARSPKLQYKLN